MPTCVENCTTTCNAAIDLLLTEYEGGGMTLAQLGQRLKQITADYAACILGCQTSAEGNPGEGQ